MTHVTPRAFPPHAASPTNDALLKGLRFLVSFLMVILGVAFVGLIVAAPVAVLSQSHVAEAMLPDAPGSLTVALTTIVALLALGAALMALGFHFLRLLKRIIDSVGEGDPFISLNADRLTRMGWIVVAIEALKIPVEALATYLARFFEPGTFTVDVEFSLTGILLALILFTLARIFHMGTAMRDDLEGTV